MLFQQRARAGRALRSREARPGDVGVDVVHFPDVGSVLWNNLRQPATIEGSIPPCGTHVRVVRLEVLREWSNAVAKNHAKDDDKAPTPHDPHTVRRTPR